MPARRNPEAPYWKAIDKATREIIEDALRASGGVVEHAAKRLGIGAASLFVRIKDLKIDADKFREA